ncbi:MAG: hypothetical protein KAS64_05040 [Spirochaetes bacterium]|nr:hypothetical protein [Spirochaetota bacterium]
MRFKLFNIVIILLTIILFSCGNDVVDPGWRTKGSLTLAFGSNTLSKTIVPDVDMNIVSYDIQGNGPSGATFSRLNITTGSVSINDLVIGAWTVVVYGKNAAGDIIGSGSSPAVIAEGQSTSVAITVIPQEGNGTLSITVYWDTEIPNPNLTAILTKLGGLPVEFSNFTYGVNSFSYIDSAVAPGYYTLQLKLKSGTDDVWGSAPAIRILTGFTTSVNLSAEAPASDPSAGTFGVYSETVPLDVEYGVDAEVISLQSLWSCELYTNDTVDPGEGSSCIKVVGTNLGVGFYIRRRPLGSTIDFTDIDYIHFMYKGNNGFKVAVVDQFVRSIDMDVLPGYGLVTNGTWCNIKIPLSAFPGLDASKIESYFYIEATPVHGHSPGDIFYIDNIYFSGTNYSGNTNTPISNSPEEFGLYSETVALDVEWNFDTKLTVFSGGMLNAKITTNPAEGSECWQFEGTDTWMGFGFEVMPFTDANAKDLSAYNYLNFNYRGTKNFRLGMRWVGSNIYLDVVDMVGFDLVIDGNWSTVKIPLTAFTGIDKSKVLQYIMFSSVGDYEVGDIHTFDNIYFSVN